ncbi:MAG: hypothetical protein ACAH07_09625 [Methylophilaceae bacterium]|nr:hypothetical protein [Methyloradius sp.]
MASKKGPTLATLKRILSRQTISRFGDEYVPSILATPAEAPSSSWAVTLRSPKFNRDIHTLSLNEKKVALRLLYHPDLLDIHEQKMLSTTPKENPVVGFPGTVSRQLPPIRGVVDVAERLGYLKYLHYLRVPDDKDPTLIRRIPYPYIGDFLIFMGENHHIQCRNLTVKESAKDFKRPYSDSHSCASTKEIDKALARHEIEHIYHADASIPTIQVAGNQLNEDVSCNLNQLFLYQRRSVLIVKDQHLEIEEKFKHAMTIGIPPLEIVTWAYARFNLPPDKARTILYQAIWQRRIRVDLYTPILINHPLNPEQKDVIDEHSNWFGK